MKNLILFILLFNLINNNNVTNAKEYGKCYDYYPFNNIKYLKLSLILFQNNSYYIEFRYTPDDVVWRSPISHGYYKMKNDTIYFNDEIFGINMIAVNNKSLYPFKNNLGINFIKGFDCLKTKILDTNDMCWIDKNEQNNYNNMRKSDVAISKKLLKEFKILSKSKVDYYISYGKYYRFFILDTNDIVLSLNSDNTYTYKLFNYLISKGKWTKSKNIIKLKDIIYNKEFILILTGNNEIAGLHLPLFFWSDKLKGRVFKFQR